MFTVILGDIKVSQSVYNEIRYSGVTKPLPQVLPIYVTAVANCVNVFFYFSFLIFKYHYLLHYIRSQIMKKLIALI